MEWKYVNLMGFLNFLLIQSPSKREWKGYGIAEGSATIWTFSEWAVINSFPFSELSSYKLSWERNLFSLPQINGLWILFLMLLSSKEENNAFHNGMMFYWQLQWMTHCIKCREGYRRGGWISTCNIDTQMVSAPVCVSPQCQLLHL